MSGITPRRPDVVTILWQRNLLTPLTPRIVEATVIGSAKPCDLSAGQSLITASICLLSNRFVLVSNTDLGIFGISKFVRLF
ncbi:hypothetical protein HNP81_004437 [Peribacillus huizhouensis]|uniref:Uncharacterized protein n=1 Tax=Peribacillus huizhouensis TaxID=1501239 RepID=A0ABR6CVN8_9BACI|nr:hypothetical protein [Peribacillus huizhouensis]